MFRVFHGSPNTFRETRFESSDKTSRHLQYDPENLFFFGSQLKACFLPGTLVMTFVRLSHVVSSFLLTKDFVMALVKANKRGVAMF